MSTQGVIVAIGGGSIGRTNAPTTTPIDQVAIDMTGTKNPNVLFLPTVHRDDESCVEGFTNTTKITSTARSSHSTCTTRAAT